MLDNITINLYPDRVAAIEIHTREWMDTVCYNAEAYQRWLTFPGDANPSRLYIDGHRDPSYYWTWQDSIVNRMNKPATVTVRMSGSFNPGSGSGSITGVYRNDSNTTITGRVMFVITEDSVYFMDSLAGQSKQWHNHTPRDYIPGPLGTIFTIPPGDSVIYTQSFSISLPVRYQYCSVVTYVQDTALFPDPVTRRMYQGGKIKVSQLIGVVEDDRTTGPQTPALTVAPNPCSRIAQFTVKQSGSGPFSILIYDSAGRLVRELNGLANDLESSIDWNLKDRLDSRVCPGVYFYSFKSANGSPTRGKVIVN